VETEGNRYKMYTRRSAMLLGGKFSLFALLAGRMYYLQVIESDQYQMLAEENRISLRLLPPPRGQVVDRFGVALANNRQNYRVVLVPEQTQTVDATLASLEKILQIEEHQRRRILREVGRKRAFVPVTVSENLSWEQFARVNVHSPDLPGIQPDVGETRFYPSGPEFAHVVGYVGAVSDREINDDPMMQLPGFRVGKTGIEKVFEKELRGVAGNSQIEVNAVGRAIRELNRQDGQPGNNIELTLDAELQKFAAEKLGDESGSAVVMDIFSGDILAMCSTPAYDPNAFNIGLNTKDWQALLHDPKTPLINKSISGQYPPGSTFKMAVALAALESGLITADHKVKCYGKMRLGRHDFHCWKRHGHGELDMVGAIAHSCDIFFYDIARKIGIERIGETARMLGFGAPLGLLLPGEKSGLIPTPEWKMALQGVPWQQGETLITGIGQGFVLSTPLQLAVMTARIANGGYAVVPRLTRKPASDETSTEEQISTGPAHLGISAASLAVVREGMNRVSNHKRGTAYAARIREKGFELAGKTGTAQVRRISRAERQNRVRKNEEKAWVERDHALFVAYAPVNAPRYAISVLVEHGGSGSSVAAPVARDIMLKTQTRDPSRRDHRPGGVDVEAQDAPDTVTDTEVAS
jgi:penicillin-binding protein 2